jgi:hypothetical protein
VKIYGKGPFVFALDTGAATSLVTTSLAKQVGLAASGSTKVAGVACSTSVRRASLSNWSVGGLALPQATVSVTNLGGQQSSGGLQGLLGSDVLSKFGAITIDYAAGKLSVGKAAGISGQTVAVPVKVAHGKNGATLALTPVTIRGKGPLAFAIDTGAATSTVDRRLVKGLGLPLRGTTKKVNGVACESNVKLTTITNWHAGKVPLPRSTVDVIDLQASHGGGGLQGLLGSNILSRYQRITLDYAHGQLRLPASQVRAQG